MNKYLKFLFLNLQQMLALTTQPNYTSWNSPHYPSFFY